MATFLSKNTKTKSTSVLNYTQMLQKTYIIVHVYCVLYLDGSRHVGGGLPQRLLERFHSLLEQELFQLCAKHIEKPCNKYTMFSKRLSDVLVYIHAQFIMTHHVLKKL